MIYILIEINGFKQIDKIDSYFAEKITDYIKNTLLRDKFCFIEQKNNIFVYSCSPDENDLISLLHNSINLFNYLQSNKNDLMGYNILIEQVSEDYSEELLRSLFYSLFSLKKDESFYLSKNIFSLFNSYADFEQEENFFKLVSYHDKELENEDDIISILSHSKEIDYYLEFLTPLINNDRKGLIFYYGENIPGISILSFCIAGLLQGKETDVPWIYIKPYKSKISNVIPLISCMDSIFIDSVPSYLNEPELSIWKQKISFVKNNNSILYDEDLIILFRIYLKAYSLRMEELFLPPMVFILDSHNFNELTLKYIAIILEDLYEELNLSTVMFSENEDIPAAFYSFPGKKVKSESWAPVSYYHSKILEKMDKGLFNGTEATQKVIDTLGHNSKHFLLIYTLFYDLCGKDEIISYLSVDQSDKYKNENLYKELVLSGLIYPDINAFPVFINLKNFITYKFNSEDEILIDKIINSVVSRSTINDITVFEKIADIYRYLKNYSKEGMFLLDVINQLIISGKTKAAGSFFERVSVILRLNPVEKIKIELLQNIYFLRSAIFDNKDEFASDLYLRLSSMEIDDSVLNAERKIICSEYLFSMYKYKKSLDIAKSALIDIQDSDALKLKTRVNLNLARILLGMKRIDESKDYFKIAKETLSRNSDLYSLLEINSHEAVVYFIYGNFSESLRLVTDSLSICEYTGRRDWELFLLFLNGRILFELGNYPDAVVKFSDGLRQCDIYMDNVKKKYFNIWLGRSYIYLKDIRYGLKILNDFQDVPEALFYSAEGLYFKKEYINSYKKIDLALTMERDRNRYFCSSNIIAWESGFDLIEDRSLVVEGGYGVLFQLIRAFRAFIMSKTGNVDEGRLELSKITREDLLSDIDLNNGFYLYLYSLTLPEHTGAEAVDRLTLLSKALRNVLKTASKIDNPKDRQIYLSKNYWNSGLMEEGRVHKLI